MNSENSPILTWGLSFISLPLSLSLSLSSSLRPPPGEGRWVLSCWWSWPSKHKTFGPYWRKWDKPLFTRQIILSSSHFFIAEPSDPIPSVLLSSSSHNKPCGSGHDNCNVLMNLYSCNTDSSHYVRQALFFPSSLVANTTYQSLVIITKLLKAIIYKNKVFLPLCKSVSLQWLLMQKFRSAETFPADPVTHVLISQAARLFQARLFSSYFILSV